MAYDGVYKCPKCGSTNTDTTTIATTERWIKFRCNDCKKFFKKLAKNVSSLSRIWQGE